MMQPSAQLLVKLGSIIVHFEELHESGGHEFDLHAAQQLLKDSEVRAWLDAMTKAAMLPLKRSAKPKFKKGRAR